MTVEAEITNEQVQETSEKHRREVAVKQYFATRDNVIEAYNDLDAVAFERGVWIYKFGFHRDDLIEPTWTDNVPLDVLESVTVFMRHCDRQMSGKLATIPMSQRHNSRELLALLITKTSDLAKRYNKAARMHTKSIETMRGNSVFRVLVDNVCGGNWRKVFGNTNDKIPHWCILKCTEHVERLMKASTNELVESIATYTKKSDEWRLAPEVAAEKNASEKEAVAVSDRDAAEQIKAKLFALFEGTNTPVFSYHETTTHYWLHDAVVVKTRDVTFERAQVWIRLPDGKEVQFDGNEHTTLTKAWQEALVCALNWWLANNGKTGMEQVEEIKRLINLGLV